MKIRNIERIFSPPSPHMVGDGFRVHNFIPGDYLDMERMSPFILLDYNSKIYVPPSEHPKGVGVHPHRGFETVSIAYHGKVAHHDSAGNSGVIGEGEVQWMTAASGVLHKEYHEKEFSKRGGDFQMIQLWVNLPAKFKMSPPKYQALTRELIPNANLAGGGGVVEVISGRYQDIAGAASTFTPIHLFNIKINQGATASFDFPTAFNTGLLVVEGSIRVNGTDTVPTNHFVLFRNDGEEFTIQADEKSVVLVLSGEPINEPVAAAGPFVMNTRAELRQAYEDVNSGKFGYLED
jgi:redox-sensitive bicupin YhaK (pirin superfamily)